MPASRPRAIASNRCVARPRSPASCAPGGRRRDVIYEPDEPHDPLERLRGFVAMLPETAEIDGFGNPTFRVATVPFAIFELTRDAPAITLKASLDVQEELVSRAGFSKEPETGHHGWTVVELDGSVTWDEIDLLVISSYRLVAPGDLILELDTMLGY